jgi:hypothetical protein
LDLDSENSSVVASMLNLPSMSVLSQQISKNFDVYKLNAARKRVKQVLGSAGTGLGTELLTLYTATQNIEKPRTYEYNQNVCKIIV